MSLDDAIQAFFGSDPIKGEDALLFLASNSGADALRQVLTSRYAHNSRYQVEQRLQKLAARHDVSVATTLAEIIRTSEWSAKQAAAAAFGGIKSSNDLSGPLIDVLKTCDDIDSQRLAIEALGFLGAGDWSNSIQEFSRVGDWDSKQHQSSRIDRYSFSKLASYVLCAIVRFAGRNGSRFTRPYTHGHLHDYLVLFVSTLGTNRSPSGHELISRTAYELRATSVDWLIRSWEEDRTEDWRSLVCTLLAEIKSVRSAPFLLEVATHADLSLELRTSASIALGELRSSRVATRVAASIRENRQNAGPLTWAYSSLRMLPIDWTGTEAFAQQILQGRDSEQACQLRYALALSGERQIKDVLLDIVDSKLPYVRWTAALGLARLLGKDASHELQHRPDEADDELERCAMLAAVAHAGNHARLGELHAALTKLELLPILRSLWRTAILSAFRVSDTFDPRAFELWWGAARLQSLPSNDLELASQASRSSRDEMSKDRQEIETRPAKDSAMISLLDASQIASIAGNAVSIIDKIYSQFVKVKTGTDANASPQSKIVNEREAQRISTLANGRPVQSISYDELRTRLNPSDLEYLNAKEQALNNHYSIWLGAYPNIALIEGVMDKARAEAQLKKLAKEMGGELADILDFLENNLGLRLDDHYQSIRHIARA